MSSSVQVYGAGAAGVATPMPAGTETHPISVVLADAPSTAPLSEIRYTPVTSASGAGVSCWAALGLPARNVFVRDIFIWVAGADGSLEYPNNIAIPTPNWVAGNFAIGDRNISGNAVLKAIGYVPLLDPGGSGASVGNVFAGGRLPVNKRINSYSAAVAGNRIGVASTASNVLLELSFSYSDYPA
jgi:hypothetical protein